MAKTQKFQSPKGTRDLYPDDLLRQRYITEAWRRVSIRHGFDEIAGPTFESLDLYKIKSGEGIVSELFSFRREGGDDDYALRPEFTPTLARLYAAKAASLPSPTKWFTAGPYFRAERPQRGRLREFLQWNCDVIGGQPEDRSAQEADVITVLLELAADLGLKPGSDTCAFLNDRRSVSRRLVASGVAEDRVDEGFVILDTVEKIDFEEFKRKSQAIGVTDEHIARWVKFAKLNCRMSEDGQRVSKFRPEQDWDLEELEPLHDALIGRNAIAGCGYSTSLARGLAYYTGTVFELIADGERAVAGGGRYDNLIELFGGPPTPAVGFGMGDVVLSLLLDDKNLMPEGRDLRDAMSQPAVSVRPEAFVIADEDQSELVEPLLAHLRRGVEAADHDASRPWAEGRYAIRPMHARRSYRTKRKKQLQDASAQFAKFAVTVDDANKVELRDMDNPGDDLTPKHIDGFSKDVRSSFADFSVDPESPVYVGKAIASLLG